MREARLRELFRLATVGDRPPAEVLRVLAGDHLEAPAEMSSIESQLFTLLSGHLLDRVGLLDRCAFARDVAGVPQTPQPVLHRLLEDDHLVASAVLHVAPFGEDQLVDMIRRHDSERIETAIARRPRLSRAVSDLLMARRRPAVLTALAGNPGADLSHGDLEALCDVAVRMTAMGRVLARRSDLPEDIGQLLERRLAVAHLVDAPLSDGDIVALVDVGDVESVQMAIAWRAPLSIVVTDVLIARRRPRVLLILAGNLDASISPRGFAVLAAIAVDRAEMDTVLARRDDLPVEIARLLHARIDERLVRQIEDLMLEDRRKRRKPFVLKAQA